MTIEAADISAHRVIADAYQFYFMDKVSPENEIWRADDTAPKETRVTYIPSDGKSKSIINISGTELGNGSRERKPGRHFTQALHHAKDGNTSEGVSQEDGQRPSTGESATDTQEQTSTDGSAKGNKLDVSRLQAKGS